MTQNDPDFLDYLASLETKTSLSTKKEIDGTTADTLKKIGLKRKLSGKRKAGRVLLLAAAVAAGAVVTAAAAGVNVGDLFRGYFASGGPHGALCPSGSSATALTESQTKVLETVGKTLGISAASNGTTVAVEGVVGDRSSAYVLLDVTAPKGTKLGRDDYVFDRCENQPELQILEKGGAEPRPEGGGWSGGWNYTVLKDSGPNDNKIRMVLNIEWSGLDLRGKEVRLNLKDLSVPDPNRKPEYLPVVKGEWHFTVPLDYTSPSKELTVNKVTHFKPYVSPKASASERKEVAGKTFQCTVKSISLSSLSATADYGVDQPAEKGNSAPTPFVMTLHFKNGSQTEMLRIGPGSGSPTTETNTYIFSAPIDVNSVFSVTVGDLTVPVS